MSSTTLKRDLDKHSNIESIHEAIYNTHLLKSVPITPDLLVKGTASGEWITCLVDSGASISFIDIEYAKKHSFDIKLYKNSIEVRMGNDTIQTCNQFVELDICIANITTQKQMFWCMPLPRGCEAVLGLDWMRENDVMIRPKKSMIYLMGPDDRIRSESASVARIQNYLAPKNKNVNTVKQLNATLKSMQNKTFTSNKLSFGSDIVCAPAKAMRKINKLLSKGNLTETKLNIILNNSDHSDTIGTHSVNKKRGRDSRDPCTDSITTDNKDNNSLMASGKNKCRRKIKHSTDTHSHTNCYIKSDTDVDGTNIDAVDICDKDTHIWNTVRLQYSNIYIPFKQYHKIPTPKKGTHTINTGDNTSINNNKRELHGVDNHDTVHDKNICDQGTDTSTEETFFRASINIEPDGSVIIGNMMGDTEGTAYIMRPNKKPEMINKTLATHKLNVMSSSVSEKSDTSSTDISLNLVATKSHATGSNKTKLNPKTKLNSKTDKNDTKTKSSKPKNKDLGTDEFDSEGHPQAFELDETEIDTTISEFNQWIQDCKDGKFGTFSCNEPNNNKFTPHPEDTPVKIELKPGARMPPIARYRCPPNLLPNFRQFIQEMLDKGWISPGESEYSAPVLIIKKPGTYADGSNKGYRFVTDFRAINKIAAPVTHYLPEVTEMWEKLQKSKFLSCVDVKNGFWNCGLDESSKKYLAISTPFNSTYVYNVLPMGYINSSAIFQRFLERKLRKHKILYEPTLTKVTGTDTLESKDAMNNEDKTDGIDSIKLNTTEVKFEPYSQSQVDKGYIGFGCCYQDDIIIFSNTPADHKKHLLALFKALSEENVPLNLQKSKLFCKYVRYLGAVCGRGKIFTDPDKVNAINNMVVDKSQTGIRTFLGMAGFYRRWISHYSRIVRPLTDLLCKDVVVSAQWGVLQDRAVDKLKLALTSYPVLRQPDFTKPWVVASDASLYAIGAVISQEYDNKLCPVAYCSRLLRGAERNSYSVQEKECLGIIFALEKFKIYLTYCPAFKIRIMTDHHSLQFLGSQKLITAGRMARWALKLAEWPATIYYVKGKTNYTGDCLSRLISMQDEQFDCTQSLLSMHTNMQLLINRYLPSNGWAWGKNVHLEDGDTTISEYILKADMEANSMDNLHICHASYALPHERVLFNMARSRFKAHINLSKNDYLKCSDFTKIYKSLHKNLEISDTDKKEVAHKIKNFFLELDLLYYLSISGEVLCIPQCKRPHHKLTLREQIIKELHESAIAGHRGVSATQIAVRNRFYWPHAHKQIAGYIGKCDICQTTKHDSQLKLGGLQPLDIPSEPGTHYSVDFKTDLPKSGRDHFNTLMVVVDRFSKRVFCIPTWKTASAVLIAEQFFDRIVSQRGLCLELVSDRDPKFTSNFWRTLWALCGTTLKMSTSRHQSTDGQTENAIKVIEEVLRGRVNYQQDNWVRELSAVEFALNNSVSAAIGLTPFKVETGRDPIVPLDLSASLGSRNKLTSSDKVSAAKQLLLNIESVQKFAHDNIIKAQANMTKFANERRRLTNKLVVGGKCYLKLQGIELDLFKARPCKKLDFIYYGPLTILKKVSPVSYKLLLPHKCHIHDVFHVDRLKPATECPQGLGKSRSRSLPDTIDRTYTVDCILAERRRYGKVEYLIKWKGYSELHDSTWEPKENLEGGAKTILKNWIKNHPLEDVQ